MSNYKECYAKARAGRMHAEEILKCLEKTRELLEESTREVDDRIHDVVKELRNFEMVEQKLINKVIQPWHG